MSTETASIRMPARRLSGRRALITGATAGIGRAVAHALAREGTPVVLLARDPDRLRQLEAELRDRYEVEVNAHACDVRQTGALRTLIAGIDAERPIDVVVANAGIGAWGPFSMMDWSAIEDVLRTNIDGAWATVHAVLPGMLRRRTGSVVLISSVLGKRAVAWNAAYCGTKYALHGLADALRLEAGPAGVHVGVVCPATTSTEFFGRMYMALPQRRRRATPVYTAEHVAEGVLRCVLRRRREVVLSPGGKLFAAIGTHFPRLTDVILSRAVPRPDGV